MRLKANHLLSYVSNAVCISSWEHSQRSPTHQYFFSAATRQYLRATALKTKSNSHAKRPEAVLVMVTGRAALSVAVGRRFFRANRPEAVLVMVRGREALSVAVERRFFRPGIRTISLHQQAVQHYQRLIKVGFKTDALESASS